MASPRGRSPPSQSMSLSSSPAPKTAFILVVCLLFLWTGSWQLPDNAPAASAVSAYTPLHGFQTQPSSTSVTSSLQSQSSSSSSRLFLAKPPSGVGSKRKAKVNMEIVTSSSSSNENDKNNDDETSETLPANLRRKVKASRPPLGHVVPEQTRQYKGCTFVEEQEYVTFFGGIWTPPLVCFVSSGRTCCSLIGSFLRHACTIFHFGLLSVLSDAMQRVGRPILDFDRRERPGRLV